MGFKDDWNRFKEGAKLSYKQNHKDLNFHLKLLTFILNGIAIYIWHHQGGLGVALYGPTQRNLFAFTFPAHLVILGGVMAMYIFLKRPSMFFQRLYHTPAILLFGVTGVVSFINYFHHEGLGWSSIVIAILCIIISCCLCIELIVTELVRETSLSEIKEPPSS